MSDLAWFALSCAILVVGGWAMIGGLVWLNHHSGRSS